MPSVFILSLRVLLASIAGIVIGYERQHHFKNAGVKTHMIVGFSAAVITIVSKYGFLDSYQFDAARISSTFLSGMGFLGAGVIFKRKGNVEGLTTAAGILAISGIGMAFGAGLIQIGIITTLMLLGLRIVVQNMDRFQASTKSSYRITFRAHLTIHEALEMCQTDKITSYRIESADDQAMTIEAGMVFGDLSEEEDWIETMLEDDRVMEFQKL